MELRTTWIEDGVQAELSLSDKVYLYIMRVGVPSFKF